MMAIITAIARIIGIGGILFIALLLRGRNTGRQPHSIPPQHPDCWRPHSRPRPYPCRATGQARHSKYGDDLRARHPASKLGEMERQRNAASQAVEEHRKRLEAAQAQEQSAKDTLENEIRSYELLLSEKNRKCLADAADVDFLQRH